MNSAVEYACSAMDPLCLGMCEWTGCPGTPNEKPCLPLVVPRPVEEGPCANQASAASTYQPLLQSASSADNLGDRFSFKTEEELRELSTPANTSRSTKWALKVFDLWKQARNQRYPEDPVPESLLISCDPALLNIHLARFAAETRKTNGDSYPPATVYQLLCGLLRYVRECVPGCPNFLDRKDSRFAQFHGTLDALFRQLHSEGIGIQTKRTETITKEDEEKLWSSGVMGESTPRALQNAAFFVVGKMFNLRGGAERRNLKISQLKRQYNPDHYVYYENVSKNNSGSFKKMRVKGKVVPVYACRDAGSRCPIHILDAYLSKLPPKAYESDLFYLRPLAEIPTDTSKPWYAA